MELKESMIRWSRMLAQAQRLANVQNTLDAVSRARVVVDEVEAAWQSTRSAEDKDQLARMGARARRRLHALEVAHGEWQTRVQQRQKAFLEREARAYREPLP